MSTENETNELIDSTTCGFRKWSIGIDKSGNVIVEAEHVPIQLTLILRDASIKELRSLGEMFLSVARKLSQ